MRKYFLDFLLPIAVNATAIKYVKK